MISTGAAILGAGALGAGASLFASSKASKAQQQAAAIAAAQQERMYQQQRSDLAPYMQAGNNAVSDLQGSQGYWASPIVMDQAALEQTPGYQFALKQGLKSIQNSAAARGLGVSGAAFRGASDYATGLANNTYKDQFNLENINRGNMYNRLMGVSHLGGNAAAGVGNAGMQAATNIGQAATNSGNAQAAAYNSMGNTINNFANNAGGLMYANKLMQNGGYQGIF
jgi:hypothetical protein